ncbi:MAG: hypothetical protein ABI861_07525, partial [Panacibacter sp.]
MTGKDYIESGILEQYVLGTASADESAQVEMMAGSDPTVRQEIDLICETLEKLAFAGAVEPSPVIKPFLMATIDYSDRIEKGEQVAEAPLLNE